MNNEAVRGRKVLSFEDVEKVGSPGSADDIFTLAQMPLQIERMRVKKLHSIELGGCKFFILTMYLYFLKVIIHLLTPQKVL